MWQQHTRTPVTLSRAWCFYNVTSDEGLKKTIKSPTPLKAVSMLKKPNAAFRLDIFVLI